MIMLTLLGSSVLVVLHDVVSCGHPEYLNEYLYVGHPSIERICRMVATPFVRSLVHAMNHATTIYRVYEVVLVLIR